MQHIKVVSDIFCGALLFGNGESLIVRLLWWRQLILLLILHADTERCVPAWTDNNCPRLRPYGGASEEQTGTGGNEHRIIHHYRSADTPQKPSHSSAHQPVPSPGPSQTSKGKTVCLQMVSLTVSLHHINVAVVFPFHLNMDLCTSPMFEMICLTSVSSGMFCISLHGLCVVIQLKRLFTDGTHEPSHPFESRLSAD